MIIHHYFRELEFVSTNTNKVLYAKQTKVLMIKYSRWLGCSNIFYVELQTISQMEIRGQYTRSVLRFLILGLYILYFILNIIDFRLPYSSYLYEKFIKEVSSYIEFKIQPLVEATDCKEG
jgi:hypothetical protein